jgi:hypothetical protein
MAQRMNDRRPATTIGELDIHLSNLQGRIADLAAALNNMAINTATKADIDSIKMSLSTFATKTEVAADLRELRLELDRSKPSTMLRNFAAVLAGIAALGAVVAMVLAVSEFVNSAKRSAPQYNIAPNGGEK